MDKPLIVMVSSTVRDLPEYRQQVMRACVQQKVFPTMMENLPACDADALAVSRRMVYESDVYLGIFAHRYGYVPAGHHTSITEMEYNWALERGIPRLIFLMDDDQPVLPMDVEKGEGFAKLVTLKDRLSKERVVSFFKSPDDLRAQVINSLVDFRHRQQDEAARNAIEYGWAPPLNGPTLHYVSGIPALAEPRIAHPYTLPHAKGYRRALLETINKIWIEGKLKKNLYHDVRIQPRLSDYPAAVFHARELYLQSRSRDERPLPEGTSILQIFDIQKTGLLILGEPGTGKTTLLLELLGSLLDRAATDQIHRVPVVFLLSRWAESRWPFKKWLAEELNWFYGRKRELAAELIEREQILPLLDGLDEVRAEYRGACIEEIENFWIESGRLPLVICSRTAEYKESKLRLELEEAIVVKKLSRPQVDSYLNQLGPSGAPIRDAMDRDKNLSELIDTPLMLYVIVSTYAGDSDSQPPSSGTPDELRKKVFENYVDEALKRGAVLSRYGSKETGRRVKRGEDENDFSPYPRQRTLHWLRWLASQMDRRGQTAFYIERVQPDWLSVEQRRWVAPCVGLVSGLGVAFLVFLFYGLLYGPAMGFVSAVLVGLGGILVGPTIERFVKTNIKGDLSEEIVCEEPRGWSLKNALLATRARRTSRMVFALALGLAAGVLQGFSTGLRLGARAGILWGTAFVLAYFVIGLLFLGLLHLIHGGLYYKEIQVEDKSNQRIRLALRNAAMFSAIFMLCFSVMAGLFAGSFSWYMELPTYSLRVLPAFLLAPGLLGWLFYGGSAAIRHFVIRVLLAWDGDAPLNYASFLDYCCNRILLHRVGNGYQFRHKLLLDYFASSSDRD